MKFPKFSILTLLLAVTFVALVAGLVSSRIEIYRLNSELSRAIPIREFDVATQFEQATASAGLPATVGEIIYDQLGSTYILNFTYRDPVNGNILNGHTKLAGDGNGQFNGFIRDEHYLRPNPDESGEWGLPVSVATKPY